MGEIDPDKLLADAVNKPDPGTKLYDAFMRANEVVNRIPTTVLAGPMRDHVLHNLAEKFAEGPHRAAHCPHCMQMAHAMAVTALGWDDKAAPRPATAAERMDALMEQFAMALFFLDDIQGDDGDHEDEDEEPHGNKP